MGTLTCGCGATATDGEIRRWEFWIEGRAGEPIARVIAAACPVHNTFYNGGHPCSVQ